MKSKKSLIITGVLLFIIGIFILFKVSVLSIYRSCISDIGDMHEVIDGYKNSEDIKIGEKEALEYLEFKWLDVGNYFKQFKHDDSQTTEWSETYYQYDGENKVGMLSVGTFDSLVEVSKNDDITIFGSMDAKSISFADLFYSGFNNFIEEKKES